MKATRIAFAAAAGIVLTCLAVNQASGAIIDHTNLSVFEGDSRAPVGASYKASKLVDASGLTPSYAFNATHVSAIEDTSKFFVSGGGGAGGYIYGDLGQLWTIDKVALWNGVSSIAALKEFKLWFKTTDPLIYTTNLGDYTSVVDTSEAGTPSLSKETSSSQIYTFTPTAARFFALELTDNYGYDHVALGEIAFNESEAAVIPEPSTLATLGGLLGMGLIAGWWRRKRKAA